VKKTFSKSREERPQTLVVEGFSALREYARFRPRSLRAVFCRPDAQAKTVELLAPLGLRPTVVPRGQTAQSAFDAESPVWAELDLRALPEKEFLHKAAKRERDLVVALDHITDPRNLGAIARSAAFFGVREVIVPERRQVLLTRASVATAQGGFALTDLVVVVNLPRMLDQLKEAGYWVIGADMGGEKIADVASMYERVVLVLGSEDKGMSREVQKRCDRIVGISGAPDTVESLNVSVAAGILLKGFSRF
jgi:23S rRNA (guanosine2251-2'-O)-methyltransferase